MASQWYDTQTGKQRLLIEQQAMSERFPGFRITNTDGQLGWVGKLKTVRGNHYEIYVSYPPNFPDSPPQVWPIEPAIEVLDKDGRRYVHQYADGHLCLYYPNDRTFHDKSTAATVTAVAAAWLFSYEEWLATDGKYWPGTGADMEHLRDTRDD